MSDHHPDIPVAERVRDLERRLIAAGLITGEAVDAALDDFLQRGGTVLNGARLVARAWTDPQFRQLLVTDGNAAVREAGITWAGEEPVFRVVENTDRVHNVIVCTLCSCYPVGLLGPSPHWYRSNEYRARVVREPRTVLAEFGLRLPPEVHIAVWDSSADVRYMVLPLPPPDVATRSFDDLVGCVTRAGLIGTAVR